MFPKTWKGSWVSLTNPEEIKTAHLHYQFKAIQSGCAYSIWVLSHWLTLGCTADTPAAEALLGGTCPSIILPYLKPELLGLLKTLLAPTAPLPGDMNAMITEEEFITTSHAVK
jgi:hypothetical protein